MQKQAEWILCPVCGNKTRDRTRYDTVLKNYPLYCPKCKQETLIEAENLKVTVIRPLTLGSFDICMKLCLAIIQPFFKIYRSHFATVLTVAAVSAALLTEQRRIKSGRDFLQALIR